MDKTAILGAFRLRSSLKRKLSRHWVRESQLNTEAIAQRNAELLSTYAANPTTELRNRIATINHRLALAIAHREKSRRVLDVADLEQLASIGLIKAIEKFDPSKGVAFSSFAVPFIRGEIMHFCRDHDTTVKIPRRWREQADSVRKAQKDLLEQGRDVSALTVALSMGFSAERWREIEQATSNYTVISLDDEEAQQLAADDVENTELEDAIACGVGSLPEQQRTCIVEKFWGQLSDGLIAARHGLTSSQVSDLINDGLNQLKTV